MSVRAVPPTDDYRARRRAKGAAGRAEALRAFGADRHTHAVEAVYDALLKR